MKKYIYSKLIGTLTLEPTTSESANLDLPDRTTYVYGRHTPLGYMQTVVSIPLSASPQEIEAAYLEAVNTTELEYLKHFKGTPQ